MDAIEFIILIWLGSVLVMMLGYTAKVAGKALRDYLKDRLGGSG